MHLRLITMQYLCDVQGVSCPNVTNCSVAGIPARGCCATCGEWVHSNHIVTWSQHGVGCTDTDGGFVGIGDTYMDGCNTW